MDESPTIQRLTGIHLAIVILISLLQITPMSADSLVDPSVVRVSYYGIGDGYLWSRHASSWHGETPEGWPEFVNLRHHGIATTDWSIPFGTKVCLEIVSFPAWAEGEYDERIGTVACGIVVDRMSQVTECYFGPSVDIWPALARVLMGPDYGRVGTVRAKMEIGSERLSIKGAARDCL